MKLLTPQILTLQKIVNFHGIELVVADSAKIVAADANGDVYAYYTDDVVIAISSHAPRDCGKFNFLCEVDLEGMDWRETKVSV